MDAKVSNFVQVLCQYTISTYVIDPRVLRVAYFSLLMYIKQHLWVKLCDKTAGIVVNFKTHRCTETNGNGWTDRRGNLNNYLDVCVVSEWCGQTRNLDPKA